MFITVTDKYKYKNYNMNTEQQIREIKSKLELNDVQLSELLHFNRTTMYKRLREGKFHEHEKHYVDYVYKKVFN
jgi:hypothetical protein